MTSKEKELEDRLREVGNRLGSPPSAVDELILLLNQTESFLGSVEQSPSQSMSNALRPAMTALVARSVFEHSDLDVKIGVTSCISEITRITAPEAPYDDDLMKKIFERIVEAFEQLDDVSSPSFSKRVAILETVAKVRSCVVMLDLECDSLILKMFQHFFKTIRPDDAAVFSSMETIMSLVIEESEDISLELIKCLLDNMKIDNNDISPVARKLGEKVISNCAEKLKPYLLELFKSKDVRDYSSVVSSICEYGTDVPEQNEMDVSGDIIDDDSRQSDQTVSDELHKGTGKVEEEVDCIEKVPEQGMDNGKNMANGSSAVEPSSPKQKSERPRRGGTLKKTSKIDKKDSDNLDPIDSDPVVKKLKGKPVGSSRSPKRECDDQSLVDAALENDVEACSEKELKDSVMAENGTLKVPLSTEVDTPDTVQRKRGRPSSKSSSKKDGNNGINEHKSSSTLQKGIEAGDKVLLSKRNHSKKESADIIDSEQKLLTPEADTSSPSGIAAAEAPADLTSPSEDKSQKQSSRKASGSKASQGVSSQKQQKSNSKQQHKTKPEKDKDGDLSLKEIINSGKKAQKTQGSIDDSAKVKSSSKRERGAEEILEAPSQLKAVDGSLVGSRIKVWWPDDKKYYQGTVETYDSSSKKHKILYDDGDIEVLLLKKECWVLLENGCKKEQVEDNSNTDASSEEPRSKRTKSSSSSISKHSNAGAESDPPKRKGRPPKGLSLAEDSPSGSGKAIRRSGNRKDAGMKSGLAEDSPSDSSKAIGKSGAKEDADTKSGFAEDTPGNSVKATGKSGTKKDGAAAKSKTDKINGDAENTPKSDSKNKDDSGSQGRKEVVRRKISKDSQAADRKSKISGSGKGK